VTSFLQENRLQNEGKFPARSVFFKGFRQRLAAPRSSLFFAWQEERILPVAVSAAFQLAIMGVKSRHYPFF